MNFHPVYRPDIDGLRAISIILVIIYHAYPNVLPSGFIGVDIFFVISGYLISSIILKSFTLGNFNFLDFYEKRVIRIFPALFITLVITTLLGLFFFLPKEMNDLSRHLIAGASFLSNILLWHEADYFDVSSEYKPLLHLWSLGVEEQFYILWPILIFFAVKYNKLFLIGTFSRWSDPLPRKLFNIYKENYYDVPTRLEALNTIETDKLISKIAKENKINFIDPKKYLCNRDGCLTIVRNKKDNLDHIVSFDTVHLSDYGSEYLVEKIFLNEVLNE